VGGVLRAAHAETRAGVLLDALEVLARHLAGAVGADRLERGHDGEVLPLPLARLDGAGVDVDRRHVAVGDAHQAPRLVLVAAGDRHQAVHLVAAPADLDAAGDLLARGQRVAHALGTHADAVAAGREAPGLRHAAGRLDGRDRAVDKRADAGVARVHGRM